MWMLFVEGGYPMWFLLAFGLSALAAAARYAWRPSARALRVCSGLSTCTLLSICTGVATDLSAVGHKAPEYLRQNPGLTLAEVVLEGVGESMSPAIFGFTLLLMTALFVTYGLGRRESAD
jgi:hypothetical protein